MHFQPTRIFTALLFLRGITGNPLSLTPRDGQYNQPACWYDQPGAVCKGAPNIAWCDVAVDQACTKFAAMAPSDTTVVSVVIGEPGSSSGGRNAQCLASVQNSGKGIAPGTDKATCVHMFQTLEGCQNPSNAHYNADCVGGNINVHYGDTKIGSAINQFYPMYALGVPDGLGAAGTPVLKPDSTPEVGSGGAGTTSNSAPGSNAGRTSGGSSGGTSTGSGLTGLIGTDPE